MKFKWPENKQEQTKYIALIAIMAIVVIVVLVMFVINPFRKAKADNLTALLDLKAKIENAQREIDKKPLEMKRNTEMLNKILQASDAYMLKPVLGRNYLLGATPIIEKHVKALSLTLVKPPTEVGIGDVILPQTVRKGSPLPTVKTYTARVNLKCSYANVVRLVRAIESENPYVTIAGISIVGAPLVDPENHTVTFDIQWPIWADEETAASVRQQLKKSSEEEEAEAKAQDTKETATNEKKP